MSRKVQVKICGLTNLDDARAAQEAGADFLGFVLYDRSPRGIGARQLRLIADRMQGACKLIGVFVNDSRTSIMQIAADCGLYAVQIHGVESATDFKALPILLWRALRFSAGCYCPAPADWPAQRFLLDAAPPGQYGGSAQLADWPAAAALACRYPLMLAGGLTPRNVADAIRWVRPLGVDVASGVEQRPAKKDHRKVKAFIKAVHDCRIEPRLLGSGIKES